MIKLLEHLAGNRLSFQGQLLFPGQRVHPWLGYSRLDVNSFTTLTVCRVLHENLPFMDAEEQQLAIDLLIESQQALQLFRYKDAPSVNFYAKGQHFPHGRVLRRLRHFALANDADDTALYHLIFGVEDKQELASLFQKYSSRVRVGNRHLNPFNTWFGPAMPAEKDACVLANVLIMWQQCGLADCQQINDSSAWLEWALAQDWARRPYRVSKNYPFPAVLAYHFARVLRLGGQWLARPQACRQMLARQLNSLKGKTPFDQLLIANARLLLNLPTRLIEVSPRGPYFSAPLLGAFDFITGRTLASLPLFHLYYSSQAIGDALLLEHQVLFEQARAGELA